MNCAEHINYMIGILAANDQVTRGQCVHIIQELVKPWIGKAEPKHFEAVNQMIHSLNWKQAAELEAMDAPYRDPITGEV
jgi:hypothetical protein